MPNIYADLGAGLSGFAQGLQAGEQSRYQREAMKLQKRQADLEAVSGFINIMQIEDPAVREFAVSKILPSFGFEADSPEIKEFAGVIKKADETSRKTFSDFIGKYGTDYPPEMLYKVYKENPLELFKMISESTRSSKVAEGLQQIDESLSGVDLGGGKAAVDRLHQAAREATKFGAEGKEAAQMYMSMADDIMKAGRIGAAPSPDLSALRAPSFVDRPDGTRDAIFFDKAGNVIKTINLGEIAKSGGEEKPITNTRTEGGVEKMDFIDPKTMEKIKTVELGPADKTMNLFEALTGGTGLPQSTPTKPVEPTGSLEPGAEGGSEAEGAMSFEESPADDEADDRAFWESIYQSLGVE